MSPFQNPPRVLRIAEKYTWQYFCSKLMQPGLVFRRKMVIFDHCSKRYYWSVKGHSEPPFIKCLPIRKEILNVPQMGVTLHGIRPPFFIQNWLQQHRRCPFLHSTHCSLSSPICFWSVWRWRTMIPGEILTRLAEILKMCHVNDFGFSLSAPGTSVGTSGSPGKFFFCAG